MSDGSDPASGPTPELSERWRLLGEVVMDAGWARARQSATMAGMSDADESWSLSGRPLPRYTRAETPYRFVPRVRR